MNQYKIHITTTGGNCAINQVVQNTIGLVQKFRLNADVYRGASKPLKKESFQNALDFHGNNGLSNINLESSISLKDQPASEFIVEYLENGHCKKDLIWLSPLTNLATALLTNPSISTNVNRLIIMGGAIKVKGNETDFAEFNFFQDPDAVEIVFKNLADKIELMSLDVTDQCPILKKDLALFNQSEAGIFSKTLIGNWYSFFGDQKHRSLYLYDPLAVSALEKDFIKFNTGDFDIKTTGEKVGAIIPGDRYKIKYAASVFSRDFINNFIQNINNLG